MFTWYTLVRFLHVLAVIIWVGGVVVLAVVNGRLARERDGAALVLLARHGAFVGRAVIGPSAAVTLIAGVALVGMLGAGFTLWMAWGLVGVFGSMALGVTLLRRTSQEMAELSTRVRPGDARLVALGRRLAVLGMINIALLLSTVAAMVFKPTL